MRHPQRHLRFALGFALLIAAAAAVPLGAVDVAPPRIGKITIDTIPIYSSSEVRSGSFYRDVNVLHVQTRPLLLKRFLLFREGEAFNAAKLAETERNLRQLDFLKSVSITAGPEHDGLIDISIVTQDAWTTDVNGDYSNDGGKPAYDFDITQKDLFGSGSELELHLDKGVERNANTIEFLHPAALGPYWNLDTLYSKNSDGNEEKLDLERPLFSYTTPWTAGLLFDHLLRNERVFNEGEVKARFRHEHRELALWRSHVLRNDEEGSSSVVGGLDFLDDSFSALPLRPLDAIPERRRFHFVDAGYESTGFRYLKLDYVDRDLREQDFNLGHVSAFHVAVSPGSPATWRIRAMEGAGYAFNDHSFVMGQVSASSRAPGSRNTTVDLDVRTVSRFDTRFPQALVSRVRLDLGWKLDRDVQFFADGQNGLRAYPNYAFEGSRRIVVNIEHRVFLGREILQVFAPSLAVFADSGQAVDGPFRGMKTDVGIGLRIGIARFESALLRIDYAYALNASPLSRRGGVLSISTQHAF